MNEVKLFAQGANLRYKVRVVFFFFRVENLFKNLFIFN